MLVIPTNKNTYIGKAQICHEDICDPKTFEMPISNAEQRISGILGSTSLTSASESAV